MDLIMIKSILLWAVKVPLLIFLSLVAYIIAPIIACFITHAEESETTGHPSLFPGKPREFLIPFFRIWQSEDAPVDEYYWANYEPNGWIQRHFRDKYETSSFARWLYRVAWLIRNPAYGFGNKLGYSSTGMYFTVSHDNEHLWRKGITNVSWWVARNSYSETGWCFQMQWHYWGERCLEIYLGYKLFADGRNKSVAMRFNPFRKYSIRKN
jgi:hypothetical protein